MNMVKRTFMGAAAALLCFAGTAAASPIVLPPSTPIYIKFDNVEQIVLQNAPGGQLDVPGPYAGLTDNWGIFSVTSIDLGLPAPPNIDIEATGAPTEIFNGTQGAIYGIFYDIILNDADRTRATGGVLDIFWSDNPSAVTLGTALPDINAVNAFTSGTFLARIRFTPGIVVGDCTTTIRSTTDPTTVGGSGLADSFADVDLTAPGAWTSALDGNWFTDGCGGPSDVRFSTFFNATQTSWNGANALGLRSNDPARSFTAAQVPEPGTLALLGIGLVGVAYRLRRKVA